MASCSLARRPSVIQCGHIHKDAIDATRPQDAIDASHATPERMMSLADAIAAQNKLTV